MSDAMKYGTPMPELRRRSSAGLLRVLDGLTYTWALGASIVLVGMLALTVVLLAYGAFPSMRQQGWSFFGSSRWSIRFNIYGGWPYIYCTLVTSAIALLIAVPVSIGSALFLTKLAPKVRIPVPAALVGRKSASGWTWLAPRWIVGVTSFLIELLAAIPSIAYGFWGVAFLVPIMASHVEPALAHTIGKVPVIGALFQHPTSGMDIFTASVVLAIMVTPIITAIVRDVLLVAPPELEQGALGLGATWWQAQKMVLGHAKLGILGGVILGFARAMGETMAVLMIIGSSVPASRSLFDHGATIASELATQFPNSDSDTERHALLYLALLLLVMAMLINGTARVMLMRVVSPEKKR